MAIEEWRIPRRDKGYILDDIMKGEFFQVKRLKESENKREEIFHLIDETN